MAGHSQFANIMHRKGRQDARRSKLFNKLAREIMVSSKLGLPDPTYNPRLRAAIAAAKAQSLPRERIEKAVKSGQPGGDDSKTYEEIRYEAIGPGRVAFILDILTDNRNRTAAEIRTLFSKNGGTLGETNSVSFMFERRGQIVYPLATGSADAVLEAAIEAGADDVITSEDTHTILTKPEDLSAVAVALEAKFGEPSESKLVWRPTTTVVLDLASAQSIMAFVELLEDHEDIQSIYANYEIPEDVMIGLATV